MLFEPKRHDMFADFLIRHVCSQNEFEACFRRLEQSARTWHTGLTSANYLASNRTPFAAQMRIDS